jgi:hypothetical protein
MFIIHCLSKKYQELKNWGSTNSIIRLIYFAVKHFLIKIKIISELFHRNMAVSLEHYYSPIPAIKDIKRGGGGDKYYYKDSRHRF